MTVMTKRPVVAHHVTERMRGLLNLLNLHFAGVALLGLVNLYLLVHMAFAWSAANSQNEDALEQQTVTMRAAEIAKKPLEGLDSKLEQATANADEFYQRRLPFATSEVAGELGVLAKKQGVKLTRVGYTYTPMMAGAAGALTEVRMDASLSGDYRPLVLFINGLERDKMFFLINGVTLTGQQSGTVGLRLRLTTYLRAPVGAEGSEKSVALPSTTAAEDGSR
jgi:type IV pilus assembly protein PilO